MQKLNVFGEWKRIKHYIVGAIKIAISEVRKFLDKNKTIEKVIFVCFDDTTYKTYESLLI